MGGKRHSHKKLWIALALVVLIGVGVWSVRIREITITGLGEDSRYSNQEIVDFLFDSRADWNTAYCLWRDRTKEHLQIPFIEDYKLVFHSPFHVEIIIHEKAVVGYVSYMGSYMYFDKDGIVVESANEKMGNVPSITGLSFGHIVLHQPLPVEKTDKFEEILNLTQILTGEGLLADRIHYDSLGQITVYLGDLEAFLGYNTDLDGKISLLADMMPQLSGRKGTVFLDTYDETNDRRTYTFKESTTNS